MRWFALLALLGAAGCGVRFTSGESDAGASDAAGAGGLGSGGTTTSVGSATGGAAGEGGAGGDAWPDSLTVCANPNAYGLSGSEQPGNDEKLTNPVNFGPMGTVPIALSLVFIDSADIFESELDAQGCDIFQVGLIVPDVGSGTMVSELTQVQLNQLRTWSLTPGRVVLAAQGYAGAWGGYVGASGVSNPMTPPTGGSPLFQGPFGDAAGFDQGGGYTGKYATLRPGQYCTLVEDSDGEVVAFSDRLTGDVFLADIDLITIQGGVTTDAEITTNNDRLFANLYAMLVDYAVGHVTDACP